MHPIKQKGFGWRPDLPDYRDKPLASHPAVDLTAALPSKASVREHCSPVRDQKNIGSCTGFAHASAVEYLYRVDADKFHSTIYSPLWMYYWARALEGSVFQDAGAFIRSGAKVLANTGITPENRWPYRPERFMDAPSSSAVGEASRWKVGPYYRCRNLQQIRAALAHNFAVVGGFSCFANMFTPVVDKSGDVPLPNGALEGGHAVHFVGYDEVSSRLTFKNSWSADWGDGGYGTLPYLFVEGGYADDFWCYERESDETVSPKP